MDQQQTAADKDQAKADAQALLDLADQLDSEADEIDKIVAETGEEMVEETKEEVVAIDKALSDAEEIEKQINSAGSGNNQ